MAGIEQDLVTRRTWLIARACMSGASVLMAVEAVSSVAIEHPEWDMLERKTWAEWEKQVAKVEQ